MSVRKFAVGDEVQIFDRQGKKEIGSIVLFAFDSPIDKEPYYRVRMRKGFDQFPESRLRSID